jgi:hypothetical protein
VGTDVARSGSPPGAVDVADLERHHLGGGYALNS